MNKHTVNTDKSDSRPARSSRSWTTCVATREEEGSPGQYYANIYIYITREYVVLSTRAKKRARPAHGLTPNLPTKILCFRGSDSSIILTVRGGFVMSVGDFPESLSQQLLVGIMLVGRFGVPRRRFPHANRGSEIHKTTTQ